MPSAAECEVCLWIAVGLLNKQIADRLGTSEKTVRVHRGQVMHKLGVRSVADLVRIVDRLDLHAVVSRSKDHFRDGIYTGTRVSMQGW